MSAANVTTAPEAAAKVSWGLRWKSGAITGVAMAVVGLTLGLAFVLQMRQQLRGELSKRANAVAVGLTDEVGYMAFSKDKVGLQRATDFAVRDLADLAYVAVLSPTGEPMAKSLAAGLEGASLPSLEGALRDGGEHNVEMGRLPVLEVALPIDYKGEQDDTGVLGVLGSGESKPAAKASRVGAVQVGFRLDAIRGEIWSATFNAAALALVVFVVCFFGALFLTRKLTDPLEKLTRAAAGIAGGDLEQQFDTRGSDEVAVLAQSFAIMVQGLRGMLVDLRVAAQEIDRESQAMIKTVSQQSALTNQQASAINETSTTVKEIAQTSAQATERADGVIKVAQAAEEISREGQEVIERAIDGMQKLDEQVRAIALTITDLTDRAVQIGDINQTVKDLAERSNMLALNASIEASKAGEQGRGFSVVAMEMRNLAEQSKQAAGQVREILGEVQKGTRAAVSATEEGSKRAQAAVSLTQGAAQTIVRLAQVCQESSLAGRQIAGNTRQQTLGVDQIVSALRELSTASASTVGGTQEIERAAGNLKTLSGRLGEFVGRYRAGQDGTGANRSPEAK